MSDINNTIVHRKRGPTPQVLDPEKVAEILQLYGLGIPMKYIGIIVDSTIHYVKKTLKSEGVYIPKLRKDTNSE